MAAFLTLTGLMPVESLIRALGQRFKGDVLERNQRLIEAAAGQVEPGLWQEIAHAARA